MELLDDVPFFPPTQWTRSLPPNTQLEWVSKGSISTSTVQQLPWWVLVVVGLIVATFGGLLSVDLLVAMLRDDQILWSLLSIGLLFFFMGWGMCWAGFQQWRYAATVRCGASAQHLYVWSPQAGLKAWAWKDLNSLQCTSSPAGTFSLSHVHPEQELEEYLFKNVEGTREEFKQLTALHQAARRL